AGRVVDAPLAVVGVVLPAVRECAVPPVAGNHACPGEPEGPDPAGIRRCDVRPDPDLGQHDCVRRAVLDPVDAGTPVDAHHPAGPGPVRDTEVRRVVVVRRARPILAADVPDRAGRPGPVGLVDATGVARIVAPGPVPAVPGP